MLVALLSKISQVLSTDLVKEFKLKKTHVATEKSFLDAIKKCQPVDQLGKKVHLSQNYLSAVIIEAIKTCPNIQNLNTLRCVIMYNTSHQAFWHLVEEQQRQHIPSHLFAATTHKISNYKSAFGTILLFEDQTALQYLAKQWPLNAEHHCAWSAQYLGMASLAAWSTLADIGLGVNLLHYSQDHAALHKRFNLPMHWQLKSQLIFGSIEQPAPPSVSCIQSEHVQV